MDFGDVVINGLLQFGRYTSTILRNLVQNADMLFQINDGGTNRTAIQIHGDQGSVSMPRQSFVSARRTSDQTINNATATTIIFDTEDTDVLGEFNTATGVFTAKDEGRYVVACNVNWDNTNTNVHYWTFITGSTSIGAPTALSTLDRPPGNALSVGQPVTRVMDLNAGGTIRIRVYQNSGGNEVVDGADSGRQTWLTIAKVG